MAAQSKGLPVIRDDLAAALLTLGWSRGELARRLGIHRNTVSAWSTGKAPIPGPVAAYLDLAIKASRLLK